MTTAREQARAAAVRVVMQPQHTDWALMVHEAIEAASDIWEPLLREVVAHLDAHLPDTALVERMKEALGD